MYAHEQSTADLLALLARLEREAAILARMVAAYREELAEREAQGRRVPMLAAA